MSHRAGSTSLRGWRKWIRRHLHRGGTRTESEHEKSRHNNMVSQRVRHALVGVIVGMFVIQFFAVRLLGWEPDTAVNAAFLIVAGAVFSIEAFRRGNGGEGQ